MKLTGNISLILHGFVLAVLGAIATVLYILGFTQLYIGNTERAVAELVSSALLFALFYKRIIPYLNLLDDRFNTE